MSARGSQRECRDSAEGDRELVAEASLPVDESNASKGRVALEVPSVRNVRVAPDDRVSASRDEQKRCCAQSAKQAGKCEVTDTVIGASCHSPQLSLFRNSGHLRQSSHVHAHASLSGVSVARAACAPASAASAACFAVVPCARSYAEVAAAACVDVAGVHDTVECSRQAPRWTRGTKGGVSRPSEDKSSDPQGTGTYLRTAGQVRGPVVGSSPGRRAGTSKALGAVTPSVHLGVPRSLAVTPGHGLGPRQQLGWKKVCGTAKSGIWVLKGESRGYALPSTLNHLGVVWMGVTPTHACRCPYKYGRGAAVGPQSCSSIWNGVMGLWGRVAPLLTPWCSLRELPTGVNLNRYAGWGSSIPWHSDDEPLFGDQCDPKVIVSMSLGSSVDFRVCSRGRRNAPSSVRLDHGDLLVMDGLAQLEYEHSTSSELQGPRVNLTYRWITQHTPVCKAMRAGVCCALPSCAQGLPGLGSRREEGAFLMPPLGWFFLWLVVVACLALAYASIAHWGWRCLRRCRVCPCCPTLMRPVSLRGQARWIGGRRWKVPRRRRLSQRWTWKFPLWGKNIWGKPKSFLILFKNKIKLCARVAQRCPTHSNDDTHIISLDQLGIREGQGHKYYKTCRPSFGIWGCMTEVFGNIRRFWGKILWILRIGEARHPGPRFPPSQGFSIECINVGGWLSNGDTALESNSHFLAVVEHRLIPARARSVANSLKNVAGHISVWAPACQDSIPGGHAGVGVVSLKGAPLTLPTFSTPGFNEFSRLGRALRVILPLANGSIAHLFVVYGYQGSSDDPQKLLLTNKLFEAVIGEAKVCGTGQPVIIVGDFNVVLR